MKLFYLWWKQKTNYLLSHQANKKEMAHLSDIIYNQMINVKIIFYDIIYWKMMIGEFKEICISVNLMMIIKIITLNNKLDR